MDAPNIFNNICSQTVGSEINTEKDLYLWISFQSRNLINTQNTYI